MTLLINCELVSRVKLCLVSVFQDIVKDCPKIRNLNKIFLKNVGSGNKVISTFQTVSLTSREVRWLIPEGNATS